MKRNNKDSVQKEKHKKMYKKRTSDIKPNYKWIIGIIIWTFIISGAITLISETTLSKVNIYIAFIILVLIIIIGIGFDIIGVAVTAADETPFHSMASRKVHGARKAVNLIRNADKVSNFCNDVIGDVCGVVSGGTGAVIVAKIMASTPIKEGLVLTIVISAAIASLTVGGKAVGKNYAISQSNNIVYGVAWLLESRKNK
jgi:Mg2+/Co2+ transporter CorB